MNWTMFRHDCRHSANHEGYQPLDADRHTLSAATGGDADFFLKAGLPNGARNYILLGTMSGTDPGTLLPLGLETLPLNWDSFTDLVMLLLNSPFFDNFLGQLDPTGKEYALFDTIAPLPPIAIGARVNFAYALNNPFDFASNPVEIEIVP
jgi:hypothetical protein